MLLLGAILLSQTSLWKQPLPLGEVELVRVAEEDKKVSWTPEGKPTTWIRPFSYFVPTFKKPGIRWISFEFKLKGVGGADNPASIEATANGIAAGSLSSGATGSRGNDQEANAMFYLPADQQTAELSLRVAVGPWKTVGTYYRQSRKKVGIDFKPVITTQKDHRGDPTAVVDLTLPNNLTSGDQAYTLEGYDASGKSFLKSSEKERGKKMAPRYTFYTEGRRLRRLELRTRPYQSLTFPGVALSPVGKTNPPVATKT